jgi:hypothetical protein
MADINLTQDDADKLMAMEKRAADEKKWLVPGPGDSLAIPLTSLDKRETFMLDVTHAQIKLTKATYQNRARITIILMRLFSTIEAFMQQCNITDPPKIQKGLFS